MTVAKFAERCGKKLETVLKWIYDDLIPLASIDNDYVPDSAREPYKSRAKEVSAIYKSIIIASIKMKHVTPKTYGLCNQEFYGYINRLVDAGYITKRVTDNVTYYDSTINACDLNKKRFLATIRELSSGIMMGIATAILNP